MATTNNITGDTIKSKVSSNKYRDNWDKIFNKKEKEMEQEHVMISKAEYERLKDRENKLECLEAGGVDNWSGFEDAMEMYHGEEE